jgi:hypothetical protein
MKRYDKIDDVKINQILRAKGCIAYDISSPSLIDAENFERTTSIVKSYNRKYFYKICIITGKNCLEYSNRSINFEGTNLFFGNP